MSKPSNVALIGMMGSGKSTVGRLIAQKSGLDFVDLDEYLELKAGKSISAIFEEFGEPYFRDFESRIVQEIVAKKGRIISCGGGVVEKESNMDLLKKSSYVVYLSATAEQLYHRLVQSHERPLLKVLDPRQKLEEIYLRRRPLYEKYADLILETEGKSPYTVADELMQKLRGVVFEN